MSRPGVGTAGLFAITLCLAACGPDTPGGWALRASVLAPQNAGDTFDATAVKDPSVVQFEGRWHVFYTSRGQGRYGLGYVAAERLEDLNRAHRTPLTGLLDKTGYAAAPQIFYFAPRKQWYLVYQTRDANYQPVYAVADRPDRPDDWSAPAPLLEKDEVAKWIDFWIIADTATVYLFYTRSHDEVVVRTTRVEAFPADWGAPQTVLAGVHEAVHVYKVAGQEAYHMIFELNENGARSFGLAVAEHLAGPWTRTESPYATGDLLQPSPDVPMWTEEVSHGEALRTGFDQYLEYDADHPIWLIQGLLGRDHVGPYEELPWRLGLIERQ